MVGVCCSIKLRVHTPIPGAGRPESFGCLEGKVYQQAGLWGRGDEDGAGHIVLSPFRAIEPIQQCQSLGCRRRVSAIPQRRHLDRLT